MTSLTKTNKFAKVYHKTVEANKLIKFKKNI